MTQEEEKELKLGIAHIFESGANERRILEMVKLFVSRRQNISANILPMDIEKIKKEMTDYRDLIGGSLLEVERIKICETKEELAEIIDNHNDHLEGILNDAQSALSRFKRKLGLNN